MSQRVQTLYLLIIMSSIKLHEIIISMVIITVKIAMTIMIKIQMISLHRPPIESNTLIALNYNVYNYANFSSSIERHVVIHATIEKSSIRNACAVACV